MLIATACIAALGASRVAAADHATVDALSIDEHLVRYPIRGSNSDDLRLALRHDASVDGESHGRTESEIEIRFRPDESGDGCRASDVEIALQITTTLPQWIPPEDAPEKLRKRWQQALLALRQHEDRHRRHALEAARAFQTEVAALGALPSCGKLRRAVNLALSRVTTRCEFKDRLYDRSTRLGLAERPEF